ncbi:uncharacterized protein [Miscanthus floridulus]|uniref:uncharacterized protein n=1 Tax=Miscanthus floridulus TaxID=154761 RepID=UPI003457C525
MSFGLKNARVTYQRAIQICLDQQIDRNIKAYINDMVIKSKNFDNLIADLEKTFANLKKYRWKLNPSKCIFGVPSSILLGYIVSARGIEPNPKKVQKLLYAILVTSCKLCHYFEYYKIAVVTEFPLRDILCNKEANGRIIKWAVELRTYSIEFRSRPTIKSQALADFIAEWTEIQEPIPTACPEHWIMYFDGALNINGAGVSFITPTKDKLCYVLRIHFPASNNTTEYEACLHRLRIAIELGVKRLIVYGDSMLVINQVNKDWSCSSEKMDAYCTEIRKLEGKFYGIEYHHMIRDQNHLTDHLSKIGSSHAMIPPGFFVQDLYMLSIKEEKEVQEVPPVEQLVLAVPSSVVDWREQFIKYLTSADVPANKTETK